MSRWVVAFSACVVGLAVAAIRLFEAPSRRAISGGAAQATFEPSSNPVDPELNSAEPKGLTLIDDMVSSTNATDGPNVLGYWYTYSDGTGEIRPRERSTAFRPVLHEGRSAREFSGNGQKEWGAGFGFDLNARGGGRGAPAVSMPFDAIRYDGIRFDAVSRPDGLSIGVAF